MPTNPAVTDLTIPGETHGDILYRGASAWLRLPAGIAGQFLRTGGAGADPSWAAAGGNGNMLNLRDYEGLKVGDDWTPAMAQAIADFSVAVSAGDPCGGVYIPADPFPYKFEKPVGSPVHPSIDLRGIAMFRLAGDGQGTTIQMAGDGRGGSWAFIHMAGTERDLVIENMVIDGDHTNLTNLDPGEQTHLIRLGGSIAVTGGVSHVRIQNLWLKNAGGDAIAILPISDIFGSVQEVSNIDIFHCDFVNNQRSGISNQRTAQFVRIHFNWFEETGDTDIDFEPTGAIIGTGPRRYSIIGNQFLHTSGAASVTLSGVEGDIPSMDNIVAFNHIYGGRLGMVNVQSLLIDANVIESSELISEPTLKIVGKAYGVRVSRNQIVRAPHSPPGLTVSIESEIRQPTFAGTCTFTADNTTEIATAAGHGFSTGDRVQVSTTGTLPAPLEAVTDYFVRVMNSSTFRFATTPSNANNDIIIDLTTNGTGTHTVAPQDRVNPTADTFGMHNHALDTASIGRFTTTGALPTGISTGIDYFIIPVDNETFKIASSYSNAIAGIAIDITDRGSGVHTLTFIHYPRGMDFQSNRVHTWVAADGNNSIVQITNAIGATFHDNEVANYGLGKITQAVKFQTTGSLTQGARDWSITSNRLLGSARSGLSSFTAPMVSVDTSANTFTLVGDPFSTGDECQVSTTGTLPAPLVVSTDYYIIRLSANTYQLATGLRKAMAGTPVDLTTTGTGTHTVTTVPGLAHGVTISPVGTSVTGIHIFDNINRNVTNRVNWNLGGGGSYGDIPNADRNSGDGNVDTNFTNIDVVRTAGSVGGVATYEGVGDPNDVVTASPGSFYRNRSGGVSTTFYVKRTATDASGWVAVA